MDRLLINKLSEEEFHEYFAPPMQRLESEDGLSGLKERFGVQKEVALVAVAFGILLWFVFYWMF